MSNNLLIETKEIGNYRIQIYYDTDAECPVTNWDMYGRYLFEYNDLYHHVLSNNCNWNDWFLDKANHSLEDALRCMAKEMIEQKDLINYYKSGKIDGVRFIYNRSTHLWELQLRYCPGGEECWDVELEIEPSDLKTCDYRSELTECLEQDDLISLIQDCAKDVVLKEWSSTGYSQGDYLSGIAYVTKERYDKMCGKTGVDWKEWANQLIDDEVKSIGMWAWGDVKGFVLEKKVPYTKSFHDKDREDEECFDWEEVDSCWGYFMETEELISEVISEHGLKEVA